MASDTQNYCIVCSELTLFTSSNCLDKSDALFLLRILLEFPDDSELVYQSQLPSNSLPICEQCDIAVTQCKDIYTEISQQIKKFQKSQNNILTKIHTEVAFRPHLSYQFNSWVEQCRQYIKTHDVEAFKYPFVFHDLDKLLKSFPGSKQFTGHFRPTSNLAAEVPIDITGLSASSIPSGNLQNPLYLQHKYYNKEDENNDISDKYESSEEDDNPPQAQFYYNPFTRQFHCTVPSCTAVNQVKINIERHFRKEHSRTQPRKPKPKYTCSWPSCGKIFKKKINHQSHIHRHRGTPSFNCKKCGQLFYYRRGLQSHKRRNDCKPIQGAASTSNIISNFSKSNVQLESFVKNIVPNCNLSDQPLNPQTPSVSTFNYQDNNFNHTSTFESQMPSTSLGNLNVPSSAIEVTDPFIANDNLVLKEEPQFEDEDDDYISNEMDEDLELSENDDDNSSSYHQTIDEPTTSISNEKDSNAYNCTWPGCSERLSDKISYNCHMDRHRGTPKQKCDKCDQLFYSENELLNHQRKQHAKRVKTENVKGNNNSECETNFTTKPSEAIIKTIRESEDEHSPDDYEEEESSEESDHQKSKTKTSLVCTWPGCGRKLSCKSNLLSHMDQHKGTPQWYCDQCPYKSYWRNDLVKHVTAKHTVNNLTKYERGSNIKKIIYKQDPITGRYKCPDILCDKTLKNLKMMKDHYKIEHLKIKEKRGFVCEFDECKGRLFKSRGYWQSHMDIHKGTPQFKCGQCNMMFYWKHILVSHQKKKNHVNQDDVEKSSENTEDKYDIRQDPLTGRYHCLDSLCEKSSVSRHYIIQHYELEHLKTKEKESFPCEWPGCGKVIGDKQTWQAHMDRHNGTPQFECDECGAKFYWRNGMIWHKRRNHGEKRRKKK